MSDQLPDLNNLERHPNHEAIKLARAAGAAYERAHPSTPGQITAASGEGAPDLTAIRRQLAKLNQIDVSSRNLEEEATRLRSFVDSNEPDNVICGEEIRISDSMSIRPVETDETMSAVRVTLAAAGRDDGGKNMVCVELLRPVSGSGMLRKKTLEGDIREYDLLPGLVAQILPGEEYTFRNTSEEKFVIDAFYSPAYTDDQMMRSEGNDLS